jgi:hypothetical protein
MPGALGGTQNYSTGTYIGSPMALAAAPQYNNTRNGVPVMAPPVKSTPDPSVAPVKALVNQANPDPKLNAQVDKTIKNIDTRTSQLAADEKTVDPNLQFQIDEYKKRLGSDVTQRAINRVGGATRSQSALAQKQANAQSALQGGDAGAHGAAISGQAGRNFAKASADIAMGREKDLDSLVLNGQGIMSAPGQQGLIKSGNLNNFILGGAGTSLNAAQMPSQLALQQGQLGVSQYSAQNSAQNAQSSLALQAQAQQNQLAQQQMQQYLQMLQMMYR